MLAQFEVVLEQITLTYRAAHQVTSWVTEEWPTLRKKKQNIATPEKTKLSRRVRYRPSRRPAGHAYDSGEHCGRI